MSKTNLDLGKTNLDFNKMILDLSKMKQRFNNSEKTIKNKKKENRFSQFSFHHIVSLTYFPTAACAAANLASGNLKGEQET